MPAGPLAASCSWRCQAAAWTSGPPLPCRIISNGLPLRSTRSGLPRACSSSNPSAPYGASNLPPAGWSYGGLRLSLGSGGPLGRSSQRAVVVTRAVALAEASSVVSSGQEIKNLVNFLLLHPWVTLVVSGFILWLVPKIIQLSIRYLALPSLVLLSGWLVLSYPAEAATLVSTTIDWINSHPQATTIAIAVLTVLGLLPALLTGAGVVGAVYFLLLIAFQGSPDVPPEVTEMKQDAVMLPATLGRAAISAVSEVKSLVS